MYPEASLSRRVGGAVHDKAWWYLAHLGRLSPLSNPGIHGIDVLRDIAYDASGHTHHLLDIYRPKKRSGLLPTVLYIHGGGFRIMSKDTHWLMGLLFAKQGYVVFNINYRLAPEHPYPAAMEDAAQAYQWILDRGPDFGADPSRIVLAGESAGANACVGLTIASSYKRPEAWARRLYRTQSQPRVTVAKCGLLQVSRPERYTDLLHGKALGPFVMDRIQDVTDDYLRRSTAKGNGGTVLADPLVFLERGRAPDRPLPPVFASVGTKDPLREDTRRLDTALAALEVPRQVKYYRGEIHAFQALFWRPQARKAWRDMFTFIDDHLEQRPS
jgi:acetyl esterase